MKKAGILFSILFFVFGANAQSVCPNSGTNSSINDFPPGCMLCSAIYNFPPFNYTPDTVGFDFPCGEIIANQWLTLRADTLGSISVFAPFGSCPDDSRIPLKMMLYDMDFNPASDCFNNCDSDDPFLVLDAHNLVPGAPYQLMIDLCSPTDTCQNFLFFSQYQPAVNTEAPVMTASPKYNSYCPGNRVCFSIPRVENADSFEWVTHLTQVRIIEGGGVQDTSICVEFLEKGQGAIQVFPIFSCWRGIAGFLDYEVDEIDLDLEKTICPGEILTVGREVFDMPGNYTVLFENQIGNCDSVLHFDLFIPDTSAVKIECLLDTFLNTVSFRWDDRPLADEYQITLNDSIFSSQTFESFIYRFADFEEIINFRVLPVGVHGCNYGAGNITCIPKKLTPTKEFFEEKNVKVFPNPSTGIFEIVSDQQVEKIEVFDISGRKQKEVFNSKIDLSDFEPAMYFLKIFFDKKPVLKKVLKL